MAFAAAPGEIERAVDEGLEATVERACRAEPARTPEADALERELAASDDARTLAAAWLYRIAVTPQPLRERVALFLHGHFVSALSKVEDGRSMLGQIALFRREGLGSFTELTVAVARDPAMIRYLDAEKSTKVAPNENFARELMELFTTGPGPYAESDIREAARAFTGRRVHAGRYEFSRAGHDSGNKTVLGRTGAWDGDEVARICAGHPSTARFLAAKIAREFVADAPSPEVVDGIAAAWTSHEGVLGEVLAALFGSEAFFDPRHRLASTRSPASLAGAVARASGIRMPPLAMSRHVASMGQALLDPPGVKGWESGRAWLNPASLIARRTFLVEAAGLLEGAAPDAEALAHSLFGESRAVVVREQVARAGARSAGEHLFLTLMHPDLQRS